MQHKSLSDIELTAPAAVLQRTDMYRQILSFTLWTAAIAWAATILWLSSLSSAELPNAARMLSDKFCHFIAFAVGGWLVASATRSTWPRLHFAVPLIAAILLGAAFGAFDELLQLLTPGRSGADIFDWFADVLGIVTGSSLTLLTHGFFERLIPRR